jgi:hypothetical protein
VGIGSIPDHPGLDFVSATPSARADLTTSSEEENFEPVFYLQGLDFNVELISRLYLGFLIMIFMVQGEFHGAKYDSQITRQPGITVWSPRVFQSGCFGYSGDN